MLRIITILALIPTVALALPLIQSSNIVTQSYLTGAGGSFNQLPNSSQVWDDVDSVLLDTQIGVWNAKLSSPVSLTSQVSGILPYANGGTNASTSWTAGSVIFAGASALAQNNASFFWDNTNNRLGIGTATPGVQLMVSGTPSSGVPQITAINTAAYSGSGGGFIAVAADNGTAVASGNKLGVFASQGFDGTALSGATGMSSFATQTWTTSAHGAQTIFRTTPNNSTTNTNALLIDQNQQITMYTYGAGLSRFSSGGLISSSELSGDVSTSGSNAVVLNTVNANVGSFTNANITINAKGLITAASNGTGGGACVQPSLNKTANYTIVSGDFSCATGVLLVECACTSACTITLPAASGSAGYVVKAKNTGTAQCTWAAAGSDTLDGGTSYIQPMQYQAAEFDVNNGGTGWDIL